jgi:hypothetical protein
MAGKQEQGNVSVIILREFVLHVVITLTYTHQSQLCDPEQKNHVRSNQRSLMRIVAPEDNEIFREGVVESVSNKIHGTVSFLKSYQIRNKTRNSPHFIASKCSLPCL